MGNGFPLNAKAIMTAVIIPTHHAPDCWRSGCEWCIAVKRNNRQPKVIVRTAPTPKPTKMPRGICPACKEEVSFRKDGHPYPHGYVWKEGTRAGCSGVRPVVRQPRPKTQAKRDAHNHGPLEHQILIMDFSAWLGSLRKDTNGEH
jgi:hypothetical protein